MSRTYNTSFEPCLSTSGEDTWGNASYKTQLDSDSETALRRFEEPRKDVKVRLDGFMRYLKDVGLFTNMSDMWIIPRYNSNDYSKQFIGSSALVSSGDHNFSSSGISGAGAYYFDTKINPSADITDFNNFTIGVYVFDSDNTGTDLGATDSTNFLSIATRDAGQTNVQIGTASDNFTTSNAEGFWVINVRNGTFRTYQDGVEVGTATSVAGSAPNYDIYLGAMNNQNNDETHSAKYYSLLFFYDGLMSEDQVEDLSLRVEILQTQLYRSHAIS